MLLTAAGLRNDSLRVALTDLLDRPYREARVAVVITASLAERGDKGWLLDDLERVRSLGWRRLDLLDLVTLPTEMTVERLRAADVIYVEGGNQFHLARSIVRAGLEQTFAELLRDKVYVGVSAGSMIFSRRFDERTAELVGDLHDLQRLGAEEIGPPFGLFDWYVKPHFLSPNFPERDEAWADDIAERADFPIYLLGDDSAVRVRGDLVDVVSEGPWRLVG